MNTKEIIKQIEKSLTGDPQKDGPFLKSQADKYKNTEESQEINRELARMLYDVSKADYDKTLYSFLGEENKKVNQQIDNARKRFDNRNYTGGIKILEEIIKNNIFAWHDTSECTYKSFGTPLEYILYKQFYEPEKEIKPVNCNLAGVYWMYGHGLMQKKRYDEAKEAIDHAIELNPVDPDAYVQLAEVLKFTNKPDELRKACDNLLRCAVTKEQIGRAYFNYSFYFSEKHEYEKAAEMLEMSKIFFSSDIIKTETEYISKCMGLGSAPPKHTQKQLMDMMIEEHIQPGPSAAVVQTAYALAKQFESQLDFTNAKYFYEIVWELTEDDDISQHINELSSAIRDIKDFN
ncbi:hypothetical protein [Porcipelethomonas sp.]|uniref:hypothetical protein n=1 Tax=Porcipelethomonas sp. TaxID=2981675 RepID=UPI003EF9F470